MDYSFYRIFEKRKGIKVRRVKKVLAIGITAGAITLSCSGCGMIRPFDKPELVTIEASQTAFLVDLVGKNAEQAVFSSEQALAKAKISAKEVQIPHRWVKTGRMTGTGEWRPSAKLIIVDRTPVTREWNASKNEGTSVKNQAIYAESKESIGFSAGMNCSAQIYTEDDAVKFLFSYNNKTLDEIMDTEIRARVESDFVEQCANKTLNYLLENKEEIMTNVRNDVDKYFSDKGITITVLGMKDGFEYDDPEIQKAINEKFSSEQKLVSEANNNKAVIAKAKADAEAKQIEAEAEAKANKTISDSLTDKLLKQQYYEKWNGSNATTVVNGDSSVIVDTTKESKKK